MSSKNKKIYIASDHAGFDLKEKLVLFLRESAYDVTDLGADKFEEGDDYPDLIRPLAEKISADPGNSMGIILGGSGQGEAIVANRLSGVRAVVYYGGEEKIIRLSREHNDANVLSLGARFISDTEAEAVVKEWLETPFSGEERHIRRIKKIDNQS